MFRCEYCQRPLTFAKHCRECREWYKEPPWFVEVTMGKIRFLGLLFTTSIIVLLRLEVNPWWVLIPGLGLYVILLAAEGQYLWLSTTRDKQLKQLLRLAANIDLAPLDSRTAQPTSKDAPYSVTREDIRNAINKYLA